LTAERGFLEVACPGHPLQLPIHRFGRQIDPGTPRILITAGIHGRENGGIRTAYALMETLTGVCELRGLVDVLPVANPESYAAETRTNPVDGKNLGECFNGCGVAEQTPDLNASGQTEAIARAILARLDRCTHLLDLHSAGEARYLPHALFFREEEAPSAAAAGLPVALLRKTTREGAAVGMLSRSAAHRGIPALVFELGGGITIWPEDVGVGVRAILSLLAYWNYLSPRHASEPTAPNQVYTQDIRTFIKAEEEGVFYPSAEPGRVLGKGDRIGTWVSLENLEAEPVVAGAEGTLLYLRSRCRTHRADTLAMVLPTIPVEDWHKE
jgi:predicted deacylase